MLTQVFRIFEYLYNKTISFRDLKPENSQITTESFLKLINFGFDKELIEGRIFHHLQHPMSTFIEVILSQGHSKSVDCTARPSIVLH
jgi:serine/threonine protein kinase